MHFVVDRTRFTHAKAQFTVFLLLASWTWGSLGLSLPSAKDQDSAARCRGPQLLVVQCAAQEDVGLLERQPWAQALLAEPGMHIVLSCAAMNPELGVDPDHLVSDW